MADWNYDEYMDEEGGFGAAFAAAMNWSGAILSVLLIAGLAMWGWKLWVRDVSGVPVVRALEGPMRVAPENPGGMASEYQGLAVNSIAEERIEAAPERVVFKGALDWDIDGWLMKPARLEKGRRYPAVVWLHGGPIREMRFGWHPRRQVEAVCAAGLGNLEHAPIARAHAARAATGCGPASSTARFRPNPARIRSRARRPACWVEVYSAASATGNEAVPFSTPQTVNWLPCRAADPAPGAYPRETRKPRRAG